MTCNYSYARDCSECSSPRCPYIDGTSDSDHADAAFLDCMTHDHYSSLFMEDWPD